MKNNDGNDMSNESNKNNNSNNKNNGDNSNGRLTEREPEAARVLEIVVVVVVVVVGRERGGAINPCVSCTHHYMQYYLHYATMILNQQVVL